MGMGEVYVVYKISFGLMLITNIYFFTLLINNDFLGHILN